MDSDLWHAVLAENLHRFVHANPPGRRTDYRVIPTAAECDPVVCSGEIFEDIQRFV